MAYTIHLHWRGLIINIVNCNKYVKYINHTKPESKDHNTLLFVKKNANQEIKSMGTAVRVSDFYNFLVYLFYLATPPDLVDTSVYL